MCPSLRNCPLHADGQENYTSDLTYGKEIGGFGIGQRSVKQPAVSSGVAPCGRGCGGRGWGRLFARRRGGERRGWLQLPWGDPSGGPPACWSGRGPWWRCGRSSVDK